MEYPLQDASRAKSGKAGRSVGYDMRSFLEPRRMTAVMWDFAFLTRHMKGDSFEDYDRVLDEAAERGYNTVRIDPMPHVTNLDKPEVIVERLALSTQPYHPWDRKEAFEGPVGTWLIEFMEKLLKRNMYYCLSAWNMQPFVNDWKAGNLKEITDKWKIMLRAWMKRFGFEGCLYVDLSNEYPFFLDGHLDRTIEKWNGRWSNEWNNGIKNEVNMCIRELRQEFPQLRFMVSLHGDVKWIDLGLELDVMDIHFYSDADPRFNDRTLFDLNFSEYFTKDSFYADFSNRCMASHKVMAPMYRARQRNKLEAFSNWSHESGIPLITTESWASWFYRDHPDLDWTWLLEWAEWSVEDAIDFGMWGWTPHNYCQPQFENWKDLKWHRRLTEKFLRS